MKKILLVLLVVSCLFQNKIFSFAQVTGVKKMEIKSSAFENNGMIPKQYTCDGKDISPSLSWSSIPDSAQSLALICDDPDAPMGTWVHWVLYNLPVNIKELPENVPAEKTISNGAKQGINDFKKIGYGGPCPPSGTHRYFFKLYALDTKVNLDSGATKKQLLQAIEGHILAQAELIGKYKR